MNPAIDTQQPDREAFIAYWKDFGTFSWRPLLFYILYPGCLAIFAMTVRSIDCGVWLSLLSLLVAIGYVIFVPYFVIRWTHTRFARFIRCPHCGDWFGRDASGAYFGPNPKFKGIIDTGRCSKCGERILSDDQGAA